MIESQGTETRFLIMSPDGYATSEHGDLHEAKNRLMGDAISAEKAGEAGKWDDHRIVQQVRFWVNIQIEF